MTDSAGTGPARDPKALRALAHPLRWKLIDLLGTETTATATRCAEVLGESEASCSYHLRILAKYGYVARVANPAGRQKPWQLTRPDQVLAADDPDRGTALAAQAALEVFLDHEVARIKARLRRQGLEPEPWQRASRLLGVSTWLTAGELQEVSDLLCEIISRHLDRTGNPALRPADGREVRLFIATSVAPRPGTAPPATAAGGRPAL